MEPKGSLSHLQVPTTCPYFEPIQSSPCLPSHCLKIHLNIILPRSSKCSLSLRFPHQNPECISPSLIICATCTTHLILLDFITQIVFGEEYRSSGSLVLCSFSPLSCYIGPLRLKYSPQHCILKHPQPTFIPQCDQQCCTPIQRTCKIIVLCTLIFMFLIIFPILTYLLHGAESFLRS